MLRVGVLYRMLNGDILVRWHNPILPSETVPAAEVPNFRLIGRVLARGGSVACE